MITTIALLAAFAAGVCFRQVMRFQEALAELGRNMAAAENDKVSASSYQNSITPPWLLNVWIGLALVFVSAVTLGSYAGGVAAGVATAVLFFSGMMVSGIASRRSSRPTFETYCRVTLRSLLHREADYRRDGDAIRADAAQHMRWLLEMITGGPS